MAFDYLSFCDSLLNIFQFLEYSDIINCKLVNNRFYDAIRKNKQNMPRRKVELYFCPFETAVPQLFFMMNVPIRHFYSISDNYIIIWKERESSFKAADDYFSSCGDQSNVEDLNEDETHCMRIYNRLFRITPGNTNCYRISSLEDGLRHLMRIIFSHFYIRGPKLILDNRTEKFAKKCLTVLEEEFRKSRSVCYEFTADVLSPSVIDLAHAMGCRSLTLHLPKEDIEKEIKKRPLIHVEELIIVCKDEDFDEIDQLIRGEMKVSSSGSPRMTVKRHEK